MKGTLTIVRYDPESRPKDRYPEEIISPPIPSPCCAGRMERIGEMRPGEGGWPFFYKRCGTCGYTVREFLGFAELGQLLLKRHRGRRTTLKGLTWRSWLKRVFVK